MVVNEFVDPYLFMFFIAFTSVGTMFGAYYYGEWRDKKRKEKRKLEASLS